MKLIKVIVTGPESTGKTILCQALAKKYNTVWIPEYARTYVENLTEKYTYQDVEHIANVQFNELSKKNENANKYVFFDTGLIITKIWFQEVFGKYPDYLDEMIRKTAPDFYFLCFPDIEWQPDSVRENGGEKRMDLFNKYENQLIHFNFKYHIIKGINNQRIENAIEFLNRHKVCK